MALPIEIQWDSKELGVFKDAKIEKALLHALTKSGGEALRFLRAESSRVVRAKKRFKVSRVNTSLPLIYPSGKKEIDDLVWRMKVSGKPVPVADFPHTQTKKGVSVAINTGKRTLIKSAFLATLKSGHEGVFKRVGKARLPIKEAFTTRVSDVFNDSGMIPDIQNKTGAKFHSAFARLLEVELGKVKA